MPATLPAQEFFDAWKKQMDEGAQMWASMMRQATGAATSTNTADPLKLWRPFIDQATQAWTDTMKQAGAIPTATEAASRSKSMLDQWIAAWDKLLADTMQTEAFAKAMGQYLDQWLSAQGPMKKAAAEQTEATLTSLGLPSRNQVIALARQLMDIDDRLEDLENAINALRREQQPAAGPVRAQAPTPRRGGGTKRAKRSGTPTETK